jgi:hypothetical protein
MVVCTSKKVPKGKRQLLIYVDEEVYKRPWKLIKMKHEKPYGALSYEVEEALSYSHLARPR